MFFAVGYRLFCFTLKYILKSLDIMIIKYVRILRSAAYFLSLTVAILSVSNAAFSSDQTKNKSSSTELINLLNATQSMSARFHQEAINAEGEALQKTSGTMKLSRPGRFYWQTLEPFEQKINSDGKRVWVYDIDLEQVSIQDVTSGIGQTPAALLSGEPDEVVRQFHVEGGRQSRGNWHFVLQPRTEEALFSELILQFSGKKLVYMKLSDSLGQTTTIRFADVMVNPKLGPQAFSLDFPKGVDVIDSSQQ